MNLLEFHRNQLQMDYFSDSYRQFELDFYRFSALDILWLNPQKNYFKLNKDNSKDYRGHYFLFNVETVEKNNLTRKYIYLKTVYAID